MKKLLLLLLFWWNDEVHEAVSLLFLLHFYVSFSFHDRVHAGEWKLSKNRKKKKKKRNEIHVYVHRVLQHTDRATYKYIEIIKHC